MYCICCNIYREGGIEGLLRYNNDALRYAGACQTGGSLHNAQRITPGLYNGSRCTYNPALQPSMDPGPLLCGGNYVKKMGKAKGSVGGRGVETNGSQHNTHSWTSDAPTGAITPLFATLCN